MHERFRVYVLVLLFSATATACGEALAPTSPAAAQPVSLAAQPDAVSPEFFPSAGCPARPPFGFRLVISLSGRNDILVRRLRFAFRDPFGGSAVPLITFGASSFTGSLSFPGSGPVPTPGPAALPNSSPIPTPPATPLQALTMSAGSSRQLPLFLQFGCGVHGAGTLIVIADFDDRGRPHSSEVRVRVG